MKLKMIVVALGLVASAASQAALTPPDNLGNGEMILTVWDTNQSYTKDLGITYTQFLASSNSSATWASLTSSTSTNWTNFLANVVDLGAVQYAVLDAKTNNGGNNATILSTINADSVAYGIQGNFNNSDTQAAVNQVGAYYNDELYLGTMNSLPHGDSRSTSGAKGYFGPVSPSPGMDTFNGSFFGNSSSIGTNMAFDLVQRTQTTLGDPIETIQAGVVSFNNVGGNYVLQYSVQAVPEASGYAMTLAGLGLIGFFGLRRRNQA
jgi:hypothetical protein